MTETATPINPVVERPLDNFSNCHEGIITHLDAVAELPKMAESASRASTLAQETLAFFRVAVIDHHHEEEKDLFPAVLAACELGAEYDKVRGIVDALTAEHRQIEAVWRTLQPAVDKKAKGHAVDVDAAAVQWLAQKYRAHARLEEERFLPLAAEILGRRDGRMASLGPALHMRHVLRAASRGLRGS
jgi:hemerythrin-like domain-containing protein